MEGLPGKSADEILRIGQRAPGADVKSADGDLADAAFALQLVKRRQKLIVRDHAAANNEDLGAGIRPPPPFRPQLRAKASSSTATLSSTPPR